MTDRAAPPASEGPPLLRHDETGRATITLNRPRHLNRLHVEDLLALQAHIATLATDTTLRVVVLTGQGRVFCSGFNIEELADGAYEAHGADHGNGTRAANTTGAVGAGRPPAAAAAGPRLFEQTVDALEALPVPTIARLNGSVFGGATDLALACDFRVGVEGMELRMPAARLGLHYYPSGLQRYVSRLGLQAAKRLFLLAETVPATALRRLGYLDELVPGEQLDAAMDALAASLLAGAPLALRGMKTSLNELGRGEFLLPRLREREAQCAASTDLREGLAAFAERRAPKFQGR